MSDLKPCPFCGGEAKLSQYRKDGWQIKCGGCMVIKKQRFMRYGPDWLQEKLINWWNTRTPEGE